VSQESDATQSPLTEAHWREIVAAKKRAKAIYRAVSYAKFDAWCTLAFGLMTLTYALASAYWGVDFVAIFVGCGLGAVACLAFKGTRELLQFEPFGAVRLALGQVLLFIVVLIYCIAQMMGAGGGLSSLGNLVGTNAGDVANAYGVQSSTAGLGDLVSQGVVLLYLLIIVASFFYQGAMAAYYFSRKSVVSDYRAQTPRWVLELIRTVVV